MTEYHELFKLSNKSKKELKTTVKHKSLTEQNFYDYRLNCDFNKQNFDEYGQLCYFKRTLIIILHVFDSCKCHCI